MKKGKTIVSTQKSKLKNEQDAVIAGVKITHPMRIFATTKNISKIAIAEYYNTISDLILPHLINRPVVLFRCTDGQKNDCFYQKHYNPSFPKSIHRIDIQEEESNKKSPYMTIKNKTGLLNLIQFSTLEIHTWGSTQKDIDKPDRVIFDLDPGPGVPWKKVIATALLIRQRLLDLKLASFVKTTGGKGLHIVIPIRRTRNWEQVKSFSKSFAQQLVEEHPNLYTTNPLKAKRQAKIFIDYLRNGRGALAVAPYSTRAKPGAPISMPLFWEELESLKSPAQYTVSNINHRLSKLSNDPWKGFFRCRQTLPILNSIS